MSVTIAVEHNFETAHRLPILLGKCQNIHGHSWVAHVTLSEKMNEVGIICDFGEAKSVIRGWIDQYLDHGTMLGADDKLLDAFLLDGSKVFIFGKFGGAGKNQYAKWPWPTVEAVSEMLGERLQEALDAVGPAVTVSSVRVRETSVNFAKWTLGE